ncbi:MAG: peptidyl-prolyl cis-trans isomerase [Lachnospiraceae bacterium]
MKRKKFLALMLAGVIMTSGFTMGCGSSIDQDAVVATLDGQEISLGYANFAARFQQAGMDDMYTSYFGDQVWSQDMYGDGTTLEQKTKDSVMEDIELSYLLEKHMEDYNVEITDEETKAMKQAAQDFMDNNSTQAIDQIGAKAEYIEEMLRLMTIRTKMYNAIVDEVDTNVTDEEAQQRTFSYVEISKTTHQDEDGNSVDYTDDEKKQLKKDVQATAKKAVKDFDGTMKDAGYTVSTHSYDANPDKDKYSDNETMDEKIISAADKLKKGDVSDVVETDENYYILRLDSEDDKDAMKTKKEDIISSRKSDHYTEVTDGYKKKAKWKVDKDEWEKVKFDSLFTQKQEVTSDTAEEAATSDTTEEGLSTDVTE